MTLKTQLILITSLLVILVAISVTAQRITNSKYTQQLQHSQSRYLSYLIADEFRQTSADLTQLCRTYVATGDQTYWQDYWNIVKWRNGDLPRPGNVDSQLYPNTRKKQTDIMLELQFSSRELALLNKVTAGSNSLIAIQEQAMRSVREQHIVSGPYQALPAEKPQTFAQRIAFDRNYQHKARHALQPIEQLFTTLSSRTTATQQQIQRQADYWFNIAVTCQTLAALTLVVLLLLMRKSTLRSRKKHNTSGLNPTR